MVEAKYYLAKVVDDLDKEKLGRVQVQILPEMEGVKKHDYPLLPWARPFTFSAPMYFAPPSIGDIVWVMTVDDFLSQIFYMSELQMDSTFMYKESVADCKSGITGLTDPETAYPKFHITKLLDGTVSFSNTETGEMGVYHSKGGYVFFDKDGNVVVNAKSQKLTIRNELANLYTIIEGIRGVVEKIITPLNLTSPVGPVTYTQVGTDLPVIKAQIKTALTNLFEDQS